MASFLAGRYFSVFKFKKVSCAFILLNNKVHSIYKCSPNVVSARLLLEPIGDYRNAATHLPVVIFVPHRHYGKGKDKKKDGKHKSVAINENVLAQAVNVEDVHKNLNRVVDKMKEDFVKHFTLRTSLGVLDTLPVVFEGTEYTLQDLAQIGRKNPTMYVVDMSSFPQVIPDVLKSIKSSGLGLNPQQDGTTLFIPVPKVTTEHRETLIKNAKAVFVKTRDSLRDVQNKYVKGLRSKEGVSEDVVFSAKEQIIALTDQKIADAESILKMKQEELKG